MTVRKTTKPAVSIIGVKLKREHLPWDEFIETAELGAFVYLFKLCENKLQTKKSALCVTEAGKTTVNAHAQMKITVNRWMN